MHWQSNNAYINQHDGPQPHKTAQNYTKGREQENIVIPFPLLVLYVNQQVSDSKCFLIIERNTYIQMVQLRLNDTC